MGSSVRPDPVADYLASLKTPAQPASDPVSDYLNSLPPKQHDYHAEFRSGKLQQRMAGANARDAANLADEQGAEPVGPLAAFGHSLAATGANIAQGIPGMEAVQAGTRSLVRGQPYREALGDIRGATGKIPNKLAIPERIAGAVPLATFLPGSPVMGGAAIGAAEGALSADPDLSIGQRAGRAVVGAGVGGATGKMGESLISGGRMLVAKGAARNLVERNAARAASAKEMYGKALEEGQGKEATDAIKDFLHETGIEEIVDELKQTRPFQTVAHDGPEMLDAVYKVLSDRSASLKKGLDAVTPNRPNIGRFRLQDTKAAQSRLLKALETPGSKTVEVSPAVPDQVVPSPTTAQSPAPSLQEAIKAFEDAKAEAARRTMGTPLQRNRNPFSNQQTDAIPAHNDLRALLERQSAENVVSPPLRGAPGQRVIPGTPAVTADVPLPPVMSGYRNAVEDYAQRSGDIEGVNRGYEALRLRLRDQLPTAKNLLRKSPEALQEYAKTATESQRRAAGEGVLGGVRSAYGAKPVKSFLADALMHGPAAKAGSVLRDAADPNQALADKLLKILLLSGGASR